MDTILTMEIGGGDLKYIYYNGEDIEFSVIPYRFGKDKKERFINALSRVHFQYPECDHLGVVATFPVGAAKLSDDMKTMLLALKKFHSRNRWLLGGDGALYPFNTDAEYQKIIMNTPVFVGASYVGFPLFCRNMEIFKTGIFVEMGSISTNFSYLKKGVVDYTDTRRPFFYGIAWQGAFYTDLWGVCRKVPYSHYVVPTVPQVLKSMHLLFFLYPEETTRLLERYNLTALTKEEVTSRFATFINMDTEHIDSDALELTAEYMYNSFIFLLSEWVHRYRCYKGANNVPVICGGIGKDIVTEALRTCTAEVIDIGAHTQQWHIVDLLGLFSDIVRAAGEDPKKILEVI